MKKNEMSAFQNESIRVIAPSIFPNSTWNDAEVLGAMIWLWSKNTDYQRAALDSALGILLPIIKSKNFALVIRDNKPVGYMNWAYFNNEEENLYLNQALDYVNFIECNHENDQVKKLWILTFFCPFGLENVLLTKSIYKMVLKNQLCYYGYHKSKAKTIVKTIQC